MHINALFWVVGSRALATNLGISITPCYALRVTLPQSWQWQAYTFDGGHTHHLTSPSGLLYHVQTREALLIHTPSRLVNLHPSIESLALKPIGLIVSTVDLHTAARAAEAARQYRIPVWAFASDLPKLQRLPALAERAGLCGVKIPHVDHFLNDATRFTLGQDTRSWAEIRAALPALSDSERPS